MKEAQHTNTAHQLDQSTQQRPTNHYRSAAGATASTTSDTALTHYGNGHQRPMPCPTSFCIVILPFARRSLRDRASVVPGARWPGGAGGTAREGKRGGRMAGPNAQKLLATDG